jgi:hypothetical protein
MSWLARQSDFAATNAKRITGGKGSELPFVPPFTNGCCRTQTPCQKSGQKRSFLSQPPAPRDFKGLTWTKPPDKTNYVLGGFCL